MKQFTSVTFRNYKALKSYSISLNHFNVLVGPNNAGKSTIIGAFRILAEGMRRAVARNPEYIQAAGIDGWGYRIALDDLPIATENIFSDYDNSQPATIEFRLSGGNKLELIFPEQNTCYLKCKNEGKPVRSPASFKKEFNAPIGFVPVLGPVEHDERLFQKDAARMALLTH
ncbi:MAG: AAA family ATPase [Gallionella sp.]